MPLQISVVLAPNHQVKCVPLTTTGLDQLSNHFFTLLVVAWYLKVSGGGVSAKRQR